MRNTQGNKLKREKGEGYLVLVTWLTKQSIQILQCKEKRQSCFYKKENQPLECSDCKKETRAFLLDEDNIVSMALCSMGYTDTVESYWQNSKYKDLVFN